ncbi:hypothetical protein TWF506_002106 [Arthrobotrys conoides]|uniref:Uncharacterized protein n=1 Tax=Arthrobotrys conoides TaxID=74498 RepID=A0AAN8NPR2_9PEZI
MSLPRRFQGCTHLFSFLSVLASSRNSIHIHSIKSIPRIGNRNLSFTTPLCKRAKVPHGASAKAYKILQLAPGDRDYINKFYDPSKPKRLRTQQDFLKALRNHGYVPAIDRVDEMLDPNRSPFQSKDEFDKLTLGLLLSSAKSANGEIRNPYRIPGWSAGQNPVVTREHETAAFLPPQLYFLFPDDTNWATISKLFPLPEPPRPWHPVKMIGMKQDYTREEVARRLEWSQVQNAKKIRNGYNWPAPDPASYKAMTELPPPPPPVIRACNNCQKPRYLMRFWNFFIQRWQHVAAPHRPIDCAAHKSGGGGRLMYAPKGTKIGSQNPSKVEDKEWIEEETAVRLLFRCGFVALPTINPLNGENLALAAVNKGDNWPWTRDLDVNRWALRGGRKNGLVDLSKVKTMDQFEAARKEQQQQFLDENADFLEEIREVLKEHPITPESLAEIPPGQFYPRGHPAVDMWQKFEMEKVRAHRAENKAKMGLKTANRKALRKKLMMVDKVLAEMKKTKAEILLIESGLGESWVDPIWANLKTIRRSEIISKKENKSNHILITASKEDFQTHGFTQWGRADPNEIVNDPTSLKETFTPKGWLSRAAGSTNGNVDDVGGTPFGETPLDPQQARAPNFSVNRTFGSESQKPISTLECGEETEEKPPPFRTTPRDLKSLYRERFRDNLAAKSLMLNPNIEEEEIEIGRIKERLQHFEKRSVQRAIQREEDAFTLKQAMLWANTRVNPATDDVESHKIEPEYQDKI